MNWLTILSHLGQNLLRTWFLWVFLVVVYPLVAAWVVLWAERHAGSDSINRYRDALYFVTACMTIGSVATPKSGWAKVIAICSGVVGIVFLGLMVWLIAVSFE